MANVSTLATPLKYAHFAEVEGFGEFPFDMLRYDGCYPTEERDAGQMVRYGYGDQNTGVRKVRVTMPSPHKVWPFTVARWESFGWKCREISNFDPRE